MEILWDVIKILWNFIEIFLFDVIEILWDLMKILWDWRSMPAQRQEADCYLK